MGSDFDKHSEEAKTHPLVENLDDVGDDDDCFYHYKK